ncbi:MAG: ATP-binding protein, partial [Nevskia sp.]|nr:ATP-binding protein [Nevskia sp.]
QLDAVDGDVRLDILSGPPPEAVPGRPVYQRFEAELQRLTGADTRVTFERGARERMRIDFRAADGYYRLSLATTLSWASLLPELWLFLAMGLAVAAAVLIVLLQVNRPLRRGAESLARSVSELSEIEMPASAPQEFRVFAERLNALAQRLRVQDRERGLILAGVSHDLRAPLTRIRMRAELIDDPVAAKGLARDVESMRHIIDQFLDYQKAGASAHTRRVDVGEVARGAVARHRELGRTVDLSEHGTLTVTATPGMIERIFDNLIDNAFAYGAAPVEVRVEHGPSGGLLQVRDHGAGIPPLELERLLRPFERLDEARSEQGHCGLGLPIVERLVQQIGGRLTLNNPPGGGLQVTMRF